MNYLKNNNISKVCKFLRKLRKDKNELLYDMANKLGIGSAYLSGVENRNYKLSKEQCERLISIYHLKDEDIEFVNNNIMIK